MGKYTDQLIADRNGIVKKNIIKNNTTTIVYGQTIMDLKNSQTKKINQTTEKILLNLGELQIMPIVTRGVAKLHPDDKYDENTGIHVASRKAELKGRVKYYNKLADTYNLVSNLLDLLEAEMTNEEAKLHKIEDDLNGKPPVEEAAKA